MKSFQEKSIPDIILFALSRWDNPYSSTALSIAREFSKKTRVFYVDNPYTAKDVLFSARDKQLQRRRKALLFRSSVYTKIGLDDQHLVALILPLVLPVNFLQDGMLYRLLSKFNDAIVFNAIRKMMRRYNISNFIFINVFNPFYCRQFPAFFKPRLFIYYTMDDIAHSHYVKKHGPRLENEAMKKATFTLATSRELENIASRKSKCVYYLPNGVDHTVFLNSNHRPLVPEEYKAIDKPIIAFIGNCDHRLDYDLIKIMLTSHKDKMFVMLGPHSIEESVIDELRAYPNALILGRKPQTEIPAYLTHAHCLIIPYKCNTLTKSIYPLKLNEYLASGTPVVITPFSEDVVGFSGVVMLSESPADFCDKIAIAINDDNEEKREERKLAASLNKWEDRAKEFWRLVEIHLQSRPDEPAQGGQSKYD